MVTHGTVFYGTPHHTQMERLRFAPWERRAPARATAFFPGKRGRSICETISLILLEFWFYFAATRNRNSEHVASP